MKDNSVYTRSSMWQRLGTLRLSEVKPIVGSSPGNAGYQPALPRSDLNLKEIRLIGRVGPTFHHTSYSKLWPKSTSTATVREI